MYKKVLEKLIDGQNLKREESHEVFLSLLNETSPSPIAALLVLLRSKGETSEEILGAIDAMRKTMIPVNAGSNLLDIVGTGGDGAETINISTGASILAASLGIRVAKHGNRASSSLCGSADVLETLGVKLLKEPSQVANCIREIGIGFMYAPFFYPALKGIAKVRKELRIRTLFNLIGPLLNPAFADHYLIGVYDPSLLSLYASILCKMPIKRALVFHGNGLDELSCLGDIKALEISQGKVSEFSLSIEEIGLRRCCIEDLKGGGRQKNASLLAQALSGTLPLIGETLALNAGVALYVLEKVPTVKEGVKISLEYLRKKKALEKLYQLIAFTQIGGKQ